MPLQGLSRRASAPSAESSFRAIGLATVTGGLITLVSLLPLDSVAYDSTTMHVAIETAATFGALLCACLCSAGKRPTPR